MAIGKARMLMLAQLLTLQLLCFPVWKAFSIRLVHEQHPPLLKQPTERLRAYKEAFPTVTDRPLIGILSQPGDGDGKIIIHKLYPTDPENSTISYIAASYVKFVEAAGARAVPLIYNEPDEILERKFAAINGILFPGGSASLQEGPFYRTAEKLFKMAIAANDKGDYFPVWGTCLGFELLCIIISQDHGILEDFNAQQKPAPLNFKGDWAKNRNLFKWIPKDVVEKLNHQDLAMENHKFGLTPEKFSATESLACFFEVLTTTPDNNNKVYVSTVESYRYPVTGVQWHPEKHAFEWGVASIPHSADAVSVTQGAANFFVSEARKSGHKPSSEAEEREILIYNYEPVYSGKDGNEFFDQSYVFY